jgi:hypothetical protein
VPKNRKRSDLQVSRADLLAAVARRMLMRRRRAEEKACAKLEMRVQHRHERTLARRDKSVGAAVARIKACQENPTTFQVQQLARMLARDDLSPMHRAEAASVLLRLSE